MKYDITKREYKRVLFALKRLYYYLYNTYFLLEINTKVLIYQLNKLMTDLSNILFNYWIIWIRNFNFDVKHINSNKNITANTLLY